MTPTVLGNRWILNLPDHRNEFWRQHPNWEVRRLLHMKARIKPDDVICDVGAEQGDLSALYASWVPDGGVVLIEPQPLYWPIIQETFEANGLAMPKASFVGFAAGRRSDTVGSAVRRWPSEVDGEPGPDAGFYHLNEHSTQYATLDQLCDDPPTALVIDVEGSELRVLRGATEMLGRHKPKLWVSIHPPEMVGRYGDEPQALLDFVESHGYRWEFLAFHGELHFYAEAR